MGLETVTYISDLVITNPVGATDPKSQGDDHIRNLKIGLKNTFPNITGAVTLSHTQINDAARKSVSNTFTGDQLIQGGDLNINSDTATLRLRTAAAVARGRFQVSGGGVFLANDNSGGELSLSTTGGGALNLNGVNVTDYARLSQSNTFTAGVQRIYGNNGAIRLKDAGGTADRRVADFVMIGATMRGRVFNDAEDASAQWLQLDIGAGPSISAVSIVASSIALSGPVTLNGVSQTDFARLSQNNGFTGLQTITTAGAANSIQLINSGASITAILGVESANMAIGLSTNHGINVYTNNLLRLNITNGGNFDFKGGTVTRNNSSASEVGTAGAPGRNVGASGNTAATDAGGTIHLTSGSAQTFTLDSDPPVDSLVIIDNQSGNSWTIAASGTLTWAMTGGTGNRTLANNGMIAGLHLGSGNWKVNGGGLS